MYWDSSYRGERQGRYSGAFQHVGGYLMQDFSMPDGLNHGKNIYEGYYEVMLCKADMLFS